MIARISRWLENHAWRSLHEPALSVDGIWKIAGAVGLPMQEAKFPMPDSPLISAVRKALAERSPWRRILAGISGGCDSMVLLHLLHLAGCKNVIVCHLNHQLRGRASLADARLVEKSAKLLGYDFISEAVDVKLFAKQNKFSIETAARNARHEFFGRCAKAFRCREIWLAHHADDQVETVLMNILRGSALRGIGGMRRESELNLKEEGQSAPQKAKPPLTLIRPLLNCWREEIRTFAKENKITFREDASNASTEHLRNRIRHELLPIASKVMGRDVRQPLLRLSETSKDEDFLLDKMSLELLAGVGESISIKPLLEAPVVIQRRALHQWLKSNGVPNLSFELVESIRAILPTTSKTAKLNLPGGRFVRRKAGQLFICD